MMHGYGWNSNSLCGYGAGYFNVWHILFMVGVVIVTIAIILLINSKKQTSDPVEALKILYVKGEISEEEYLQRKNVIERK